jgi:hypothetical protein
MRREARSGTEPQAGPSRRVAEQDCGCAPRLPAARGLRQLRHAQASSRSLGLRRRQVARQNQTVKELMPRDTSDLPGGMGPLSEKTLYDMAIKRADDR